MRAAVLIAAVALAGPVAAQPAPAPDGRALYAEHCGLCHGPRGHATTLMRKRLGEAGALVEARTNPSARFLTTVVRRGLGSMPPLRRAELDDAALRALTDYLIQPPAARQGTPP